MFLLMCENMYILKVYLKGYLRYQKIPSQNVLQVKNFFIS